MQPDLSVSSIVWTLDRASTFPAPFDPSFQNSWSHQTRSPSLSVTTATPERHSRRQSVPLRFIPAGDYCAGYKPNRLPHNLGPSLFHLYIKPVVVARIISGNREHVLRSCPPVFPAFLCCPERRAVIYRCR